MDKQDIILYAGVVSAVVVVAFYLLVWNRDRRTPVTTDKKPEENRPLVKKETLMLQLQAYERLVLLTERISLQSLITRIPSSNLTSRQFLGMLADQIRSEADHNITQQIYVSEIAWQSVCKLREQNIFTLNRLADLLPPDATGMDLARAVAELLRSDPNASLHSVVAEVLNKEAKKLMS